MKRFLSILLLFITAQFWVSAATLPTEQFYKANNTDIQYIGRVDFSNPEIPRFWASGVYVNFKFKGGTCRVIINDQVYGENNHNYLEIVVDGKLSRIQTTKKADTITIAKGLSNGVHSATICKDTESSIGYVEVGGVFCKQLLPPPPLPQHKIEFIGNSITCGTGLDQSEMKCNIGQWYDQHNAYLSYGALTSRSLNAQWQLTSVSGIGLMHSCCGLEIVMPDVFDKVDMRDNKGQWDFTRYQPDVVTVCLGQNDGIQDSLKFCDNYVNFLKTIRQTYTKADIVCLTSPMADEKLKAYLVKYLTAIVKKENTVGDKKVSLYVFKKWYNHGCGGHPDMAEHKEIAKELTAYIKDLKNW
jgi:hypothetical protein